jgi:hypothetical protein
MGPLTNLANFAEIQFLLIQIITSLLPRVDFFDKIIFFHLHFITLEK